MAKEGRYLDALKLIKDFNPFPAVCGAICNRRCEQQCTRGLIDEPLAIDEIKKFIAEQELYEDKRYERGHKQHKREALKVKMTENPEEEEVRLWEDASVPWPDSWRKHRKP